MVIQVTQQRQFLLQFWTSNYRTLYLWNDVINLEYIQFLLYSALHGQNLVYRNYDIKFINSVIITWLKIQVISVLVFRGAFMFLKPSLSEVSIIYYLPFSKTVWITFTLIVVILTFGQELSNRLHRNVNKSESNEPTEWSEAILNSIGIVCEQGNVSGAK